KGASMGVLFKSAEAIEFLRKVDTLVVDKTGTLTEGKPKLTSVQPAAGVDELRLLQLAASVERASEHPLAAAIVAAAEPRGLALSKVESFESVTGKGVRARVDGSTVLLGNRAFLKDAGIEAPDETAMLAAVDGHFAGTLRIVDPVKTTSAEAIRQLHDEGI